MRRTVVALAALAAAVCTIALTTGCGGVSSQATAPSGQWRPHEREAFALEVPKSWKVAADPGGRVRIEGQSSQRVVIWPFFVAGQLSVSSSRAVARGLASKALPGVTWVEEPTATRSGVLRLTGDGQETKAVSMLAYTRSRVGTAGYLYVAAARRDAFPRAAPTFARILASFQARGKPSKEGTAVRFERWTDPVESAFSVEAPAGWSVQGGTQRPSSLLVQVTVSATSPDSEITALMTDALPLYVEPSELLEVGGIYEGGTYVDPTGYSSPVRRYARGAHFVAEHVLPAHVPDADVTRLVDQPALARQLATYGLSSYDVGEIEYRFRREGVPYIGAGLCITERISLAGYGGWHVWRLFLAEAPSGRYGEAIAALGRLAASFQIDRGWAGRQAETTRRQSGIITRMSADIGETLDSGYWAKQDVHDALADRKSRATLEVEDLTDESGTTYRVESGSSYYWLNPQGTIVGTDTHTRPDVDFRELVGVGR